MDNRKLAYGMQQEKATISVLVFAFFLTACATALHSPDFEKDAFAANTELNSFLVANKSKNEKIPYKSVIKDYNKIEILLDKMVLRARLVDNNEKTVEIAEKIRENFKAMRTDHQKEVSANPAFFAGKQMTYENLFYSLLLAEKSKPASK